jgi:signal transduction histidine kinase
MRAPYQRGAQRMDAADVLLGVLQTSEPDLQISPWLARMGRYWFACAAVGVALAVDLLFSAELEAHRYAPFVFAIILVAFFGDLGSSLTATLLAIVATNYSDALIEHRVRLDADDFVQLAIFVSIAVSINVLATRRKRAERQLARANAELRILDSAKDRFIAAVSHELRTPITVIQGWAQILSGEDGERMRPAAAAAIEQSARVQARLVEDLLDMSRLMLNKLQLRRSLVNISDTVIEVTEMIRPVAEAKNIDVQVAVPRDRCMVDGDPVRLQQILWNLIQNAVKFTPDGGHVGVRLDREERSARVTVSDDGDGIAGDLLPHLFDPFRQGDGAASKGGLGLGLAIAQQLTIAHGGSIEAQSDGTGQGARFILRLPLESAAPESRSAG